MSNRMAIGLVRLTFGILGFVLVSAPLAQTGTTDSSPPVTEKGKDAYTRFLSAEHARAFAVSPTGGWGVASKRESRTTAVLAALYFCNKANHNICRTYAVNDDTVYQRYSTFEQGSRAIVEKLKAERFSFSNYGDEQRDYGIASTEALRAEPYHAETPLLLKGVRTVTTIELVKMMTSATPPILVDVLEGDGHKTIPSAYWVRGAGLTGGEDRNADIRDRLGFVLTGLSGKDKAVSLIFFCLDSMCWLSHNAAMRARDLGYSNVLWYRGGTKAWDAARLATLEAAQYGQVH